MDYIIHKDNTLIAIDTYGNKIEHYGRKGQKWGQHIFGKSYEIKASLRARKYASAYERARKRVEKHDEKLAKKKLKEEQKYINEKNKIETKPYKKQDARHLNDDELDAAIKRLQKEKDFRDLVDGQSAATISSGKKFAKKVGTDVVEKAFINASASVLKDIIVKVEKDMYNQAMKSNGTGKIK